MRNLILLPAVEPGALTPAEIDATMAFAQAERPAATHKAYSSDWADFAALCHARGASPLPAHPGLVAAYLSDLAQAGRKASTVGRRDRHRARPQEPGHRQPGGEGTSAPAASLIAPEALALLHVYNSLVRILRVACFSDSSTLACSREFISNAD